MNRPFHRHIAVALAALTIALAHAQTCPFDNGGSDAINDGVVLTRYALGITGAPLTASTRYASLDPLQVKANIECVGCALDINGDSQVDTVDTTIIARHLAGFQGASLTAGLALGAGTRNTTAAVVSFLANGCAVGGAINAFVQGGNAFAAPAVIGTTDAQPVVVRSAGGSVSLLVNPENDGLRIVAATDGFSERTPNVINGNAGNSVSTGKWGATIAGGGSTGFFDGFNRVTGSFGTIGGGYKNTAAFGGTIAGGYSNSAGDTATVGGGGGNSASGVGATITGGLLNTASGLRSTVAGGETNAATGDFSFAAGRSAKANHNGAFVWGDSTFADVTSTAVNQFVIRAGGGIRLPGAGENQPGNSAKQSGTNMFTHVVPASGPCNSTGPFGRSRTAVDHPLANGKPDAILVVTPSLGALSAGAPGYNKPVFVFYDDTGSGFCPVGRWVIANPNGDQDMVAGMKFNVFVLNP